MILFAAEIEKSVFDCLVNRGDVTLAQRLFSAIPPQRRTPFVYTAMINGIDVIPRLTVEDQRLFDVQQGLLNNDRHEEALTLLQQMTMQPNEFLCPLIFRACTNLVDERSKKFGRQVFEEMPDKYRNDTVVINAALYMFVAFGDLQKAKELFASMKVRNVISYGAMIKACQMNNDPRQTLDLFWQMKRDRIELNAVTCVQVIKACSEIGMIEYSRSIASQIPPEYLTNPILQNALVNMWASDVCGQSLVLILDYLFQGKAGSADEAEAVFRTIAKPDRVSFCTMSKDILLSRFVPRLVC